MLYEENLDMILKQDGYLANLTRISYLGKKSRFCFDGIDILQEVQYKHVQHTKLCDFETVWTDLI